jgi:hypothetical protein
VILLCTLSMWRTRIDRSVFSILLDVLEHHVQAIHTFIKTVAAGEALP